MPCMELFDKQDKEYKRYVLGDSPRIAVEAASTFGWDKYVDETIGMETFGASGQGQDVYNFFGITVDEIVKRVEKLLILK